MPLESIYNPKQYNPLSTIYPDLSKYRPLKGQHQIQDSQSTARNTDLSKDSTIPKGDVDVSSIVSHDIQLSPLLQIFSFFNLTTNYWSALFSNLCCGIEKPTLIIYISFPTSPFLQT